MAVLWRGHSLDKLRAGSAREIYPHRGSIKLPEICRRIRSNVYCQTMRTVKPEPEGPKPHHLNFRRLPGPYAVVRLPSDAAVPDWATKSDFTSITRTAHELSIVCSAANLPQDSAPGPRWICLKLEGPFPFSQTGVLLSFIKPLSDNAVPIFAISTYDTDYVLVQEEYVGVTLRVLQEAGHELFMQEDSAIHQVD